MPVFYQLAFVLENDIEKRTMNGQIIRTVILNESPFSKPVHEKAYPRTSRANHLRFCCPPAELSLEAGRQTAAEAFGRNRIVYTPFFRTVHN